MIAVTPQKALNRSSRLKFSVLADQLFICDLHAVLTFRLHLAPSESYSGVDL
jgi:hypothetical protein